jgi:excisionase family DNA binding protein
MAKKARKVTPIDLEEMVTLPEAARLLDFNETYIRRLVIMGRIVGIKFGRNYLVNKKSALAFQKTPGSGRPKLRK